MYSKGRPSSWAAAAVSGASAARLDWTDLTADVLGAGDCWTGDEVADAVAHAGRQARHAAKERICVVRRRFIADPEREVVDFS
ncbi:hypothetical protein GCM10009812_37490 [Nocardioides marinus]